MKTLRTIVVVALLAYVAWIAVPGVQTFFTQYLTPAEAGPPPPPEAAVDELAPAIEAAPQAEATATAVAEGDAPKISLWMVAVGFYLVAAWLLANGSARAFVAYLIGFGADVLLMQMKPDFQVMRSAVADAVPDLKWIVIGGLVLIGIGMLAAAGGGKGRRERHA